MSKIIKKISFIFVICISFVMLNSDVKAVGSIIGATGTLTFGNSSFTKTFTFGGTGTSQTGVLTGKHSHFYQMYLNGYPALCFGLQQAARSGDVYQDTGVSVDSYPNGITMRKAYQYFMNNPNDKQGFVVSQIAIWMIQFGGNPNSAEFLGYVTQAYQKFGYNIYDSSVQQSMVNKINAINNTSPYTGSLTVWTSNRINGQPLIAPGKSNGIYACDDNTLQKEVTSCVDTYRMNHPTASVATALAYCKNNLCQKNVASCPGGDMVKTGNVGECEDNNETSAATFSYTATAGSNENVHRQYGEVQNVAGLSAYCKLYCQETGMIVLPGGFGNALTSGTKVVWPTSANTKNTLQGNVFPLKFSGSKTCQLAIEDPNAPGQGCTYTPLEDYTKTYNTTSSLARQKDIDGRNYETVRTLTGNYYIGNAGQQTIEAYCGDLGNKNSSGDAVWYTAKSTGYYNVYSAAANSLRNSTVSTAQSVQSCAGDDSCHYKECCLESHREKHCKGPGETNCSYSTVCDREGHASKCGTSQEYNNRVESNRTSVANYESKVGNSINYCKTYITNFNATRNLANEISKCFNYETVGCVGNSSTCSIYNFTAQASLDFQDTEYSYSNSLKQVDNVNYTCTNCTVANKMRNYNNTYTFNQGNRLYTPAEMSANITTIKNRTITVSTNNVSFEMDSPYRYVNKKSGAATTSPSEFTIDVGYNFLPLSYQNDTGKKYEIGISGMAFGDTSGSSPRFSSINNYVCHYTVKGTGSNDDECVCPIGTVHEGIDLFNTLKDSNGTLTCSDAQLKYCNDDSTTDEDFPQDEKEDKYCPNDMSKKITACLNNGFSYDYCVNLICEDGSGGSVNPGGSLDSNYYCKNTNGVSGKMDITSCVYTKVLQGFTISQAIDECDSLVCPISGGIKIIYRTISLENPFPGKNIAKQVSGFNQDVKGRYPGTNWNSLDLVKNGILYNRGVTGSAVYKEEPLYTFVLTTNTIKSIRSYNDTRDAASGYADFTLKCQNKNSTACVSSFVHNIAYGLTGGKCANSTSKNNFYICSK